MAAYACGHVTASSLLWAPGMSRWVVLGEVVGGDGHHSQLPPHKQTLLAPFFIPLTSQRAMAVEAGPPTPPFYVRALYAFDGVRHSDLRLSKGDIIVITEIGVLERV